MNCVRYFFDGSLERAKKIMTSCGHEQVGAVMREPDGDLFAVYSPLMADQCVKREYKFTGRISVSSKSGKSLTAKIGDRVVYYRYGQDGVRGWFDVEPGGWAEPNRGERIEALEAELENLKAEVSRLRGMVCSCTVPPWQPCDLNEEETCHACGEDEGGADGSE